MPENLSEHEPAQDLRDILPAFAYEHMTDDEKLGITFLQNHPGINIHIHFSAHEGKDDPGDTELFEKPTRSADIIALEGQGYDPGTERYFQALARGDWFAKLVQVMPRSKGFQRRQEAAIAGSHTIPILADIPAGHELADSDAVQNEMINEFIKQHGMAVSPGELVESTYATYMDAREWIMLGELGVKLEQLYDRNHSIQQKVDDKSLKIFMAMGSFHTFSFHKLRKLGLSPTRSFPRKPHGLGHEGARKQMHKLHSAHPEKNHLS